MKGLFSPKETQSLRESLTEAIEEIEEAGGDTQILGEGERTMLFNILGYGELRVDDVMVPRVDIVALALETDYEQSLALMAEAAHSRLPLYRDTLDDVVGMVHVKDLLRAVAADGSDGDMRDTFSLKRLQRPVLFVPANMRIRDLLAKMRARRTHMAIVVDEYGGTDGLVTIEDIVEEIVGDIEDEHDGDDTTPTLLGATGNGCFDADARLEIDDLEKGTGYIFVEGEDREDIDTLGGLVFSLAERVPEIGEIIPHENGVRFEVVDADPRRIRKIRLHPPESVKPKKTGTVPLLKSDIKNPDVPE